VVQYDVINLNLSGPITLLLTKAWCVAGNSARRQMEGMQKQAQAQQAQAQAQAQAAQAQAQAAQQAQ
jgi:multidrug efflux pump subunit AcrA (membrane-fusion protein)